MTINLFSHFLFYSHLSFVDGFARNKLVIVIPILTFMYLKMNGKKTISD